MARPTDDELLLRQVPEDGTPVGNYHVIGKLKWDQEKYFRVRNHLIERGTLAVGPGRGGTVRRIQGPSARGPARAVTPEAGLYEPIASVLRNQWALEERLPLETLVVEITASQGRRSTGGTWTRPDLTAVSVKTFPHVPGKFVDVWTFEVKKASDLDVTAVFEAAAHARSATRSYALLQVPPKLKLEEDPVVKRCEDEARRFSVGLIAFIDPSNFETWTPIVRASRLETDPQLLEDFISGQLSEATREKILRWIK